MPERQLRYERLPIFPGGGRHIHHDPRSAAYAIKARPFRLGVRSQHWQRRIPILNQGQLGSCTGNAGAGWLGTDNKWRRGLTAILQGATEGPLDERYAVNLYSEATRNDPYDGQYPPEDTGSDGLTVCKVLRSRGLATAYLHAFSLSAVYTGLQDGPGLLGIPWYESMFETSADGHVVVDLRSKLAGGHEVCVSALEVGSFGRVAKIWFDNSWDTSWGKNGSAYFKPGELKSLMIRRSGDFSLPTLGS